MSCSPLCAPRLSQRGEEERGLFFSLRRLVCSLEPVPVRSGLGRVRACVSCLTMLLLCLLPKRRETPRSPLVCVLRPRVVCPRGRNASPRRSLERSAQTLGRRYRPRGRAEGFLRGRGASRCAEGAPRKPVDGGEGRCLRWGVCLSLAKRRLVCSVKVCSGVATGRARSISRRIAWRVGVHGCSFVECCCC